MNRNSSLRIKKKSNRRDVVCHVFDPLSILAYISVGITIYGLSYRRKVQAQQNNAVKETAPTYRHFTDRDSFRKTMLADGASLVEKHRHIDKFYPTSGVDENTKHSNEAIRLFLKAHVRIEGSGVVQPDDYDPLNLHHRLKLPFFVQHIREKINDPAIKAESRIRFREPDMSKLLVYDKLP